ncbi:MAG: hypothetical protein HW387_1561 [Parachlamydiales bacterium]|nr:hypothetical protein [Parachlamydiales bacterium]
MMLISIVIAPFWGYAFFSIWSYVVVWVGRMFKGQGSFDAVRAAYAWSCVPLIGNIPLWLLLLFFYADFVFFGAQDQVVLPGAVALLFLILIGKLVFAVWSIVIYLQALAQVQQFSILRSIGNVVAASLVIGMASAIIWVLAVIIFSAFMPSVPVDVHHTGWFVQ